MSQTQQKLYSRLTIDSIPAWNTITITQAEHGLRSANNTPIAPTQVIMESGLEWEADGTSVVITNRTNLSRTNVEVFLTQQYTTERIPNLTPTAVTGATPLSSLIGVSGMAQITCDTIADGGAAFTIPLTSTLVSTLPSSAVSVDVANDRITLAQGVWRIEWNYCGVAGGDDVGTINSLLRQDPATAATTLATFLHPSSRFEIEGLNIGTQNRQAIGSWLIDLTAVVAAASRTFDVRVTNDAINASFQGTSGVLTLTKIA